MAVCGLPDSTKRCPDCGERLHYEAATRSYLHVLLVRCPAKEAEDEYQDWLARQESA